MFTITIIIIIVNVLVSLSALNNQRVMNDLIFYPPAVSRNNQYYRFFTSGFIHADYFHLLFNMLALYFFGPVVEKTFIGLFGEQGKLIYLGMYLLALPIALLPTYLKNRDNSFYRSLGASGAVAAVIFAGLMIAPLAKIYFYFIPIGIPGFIFGPAYLLLSFYMDRRGGDNVNHSAHIWGAIFGVIFIIIAGKVVGFDVIELFVRSVQSYFG